MVDADDPRSPDPERPDPQRTETSHGDTGHGEPVDGSELGEDLDVFTGDPVDALFDVEMSGESAGDTDTDATAHGLGEVAEFSVDARSGEELPPELMPPPRPEAADPFELELLDPTDPGITREDLEGFEDDPLDDLPPVDIPVEEDATEGPVVGPADGDAPSPPPDDPYAALAALVGDDEDDDWESAGDEAAAPVDPPPAVDEQPVVGEEPAGPFDDVPSASAEADDDKYAWLYDEDVEPPPAVVERYRADDPLPADGGSPAEPPPSVFREPEPVAEVEPEPEPVAEPEPEPVAEPESETESEPETEPEPVAEPESETESEPEPELWTTPAEPDDETRIFELAPADPPSGAPLTDDGGLDEARPAAGDLVPGDLAYEPPAPDPDVAGLDLDAPDVEVPELGGADSAPVDAAPVDAASADDAPADAAPGAGGDEAGTDDPFALAGSIFDDVDSAPGEAEEPDWESFTGEHILSSTQEYVGLAEELTRSEPPSEQMAISAGIPGLETSLVGLDDVVGSPPDEVAAETRPDLGLRILSGFGLLALFAVSLLWSPAAAAFAVVVLLAAAGEFYAVLVANGRHPVAAFGLAGVAGCLIGTWAWGLAAVPVSLTVTLVAVALFVATAAPRPSALDDTALTMLVVAWIGGLGAFALPIITDTEYRWLIAGAVAVVAALDIGQYFVGRRFGSRPLAPVLSPKKTVEGLIGGAISALLVGVLLSFFGPFDRMSAMLLAGAAVVLGPLGDLAVSMVKRILAVKDMGTVLPGHGGILDRIDALLFVIPAAWVVLRATGLLT